MILSGNETWAYAKESSYGVDAVDALLSTDAALLYQAVNNGSTITPVANNFQPDRATPGHAGVRSSFIKTGSEVALTVPLKAGVGTDNVPNYSPVLEAAGFVQTSSGGGSTVYNLQSAIQPGMTVWRWTREGNTSLFRLRRATGVVGNIAISGTVGEEPLIAFAGPGQGYFDLSEPVAWFDLSDGHPILDLSGAASTSTATRCNAERLKCRGATITWNSITLPVSTFSVDNARQGNAVQTMNAHPTTARVVRSGGTGSVSLGLETIDASQAFDAMVGDMEDEDVAVLSIVLAGKTKKVTLSIRTQFQPSMTERDSGGTRGFDVAGIMVDDYTANPLGENSFTITCSDI